MRTSPQNTDNYSPKTDTSLDFKRLGALFGTPPPPSTEAVAAPASDSSLVLLGSLVNRNPQQSSAIIQYNGATPKLYRSGEDIEAGLRLQGVYSDRVEILRNGRLETLRFPLLGNSPAAFNPAHSAPAYEPPAAEKQPDPAVEQLRKQMEMLRQQLEQSPLDSPASTEEQPTDNN